jgi:maltooligosyltrehalose trehalohydrolase
MLFMGEEYGERRPFQFFSDHIDEEIAVATRDGRRREFAAFAQFGEEIPDPQSAETFEHSKLSWAPDPGIAALYTELLDARAEMPPGNADDIEFDEEARWLRVRRGPFELVCNFADRDSQIAIGGDEVVVASGSAVVESGRITLEPLAGALLR